MAQVRSKFPTRKIRLDGEQKRAIMHALIDALPIDEVKPIEVVFREEEKTRKPDQNSAMWAGPLADIAEQAYVNGRTYTAEVWHQHFKAEFLPEEFDPELTKDGYQKWDWTPAGERVLIGSTTQLTVKGFAQYLEQVIAFGASLGVAFHANPNDARRPA
jgi:hypothetical protein